VTTGGGRIAGFLRGLAWLVRGDGLRASLAALEARLDELSRRVEELSRDARRLHWPEGDLRHHEQRVHSQFGEDGILREIFSRIGAGQRVFVEFGVETGAECNCARLVLAEGWTGLFLEADETCFAELERRYAGAPGVRCRQVKVTSANIENLLAEAGIPRDFDLLSIDIDGNDYWVWRAVREWRPHVVVIEYNAAYPPPALWVMQENPDHVWRGDTYHGASLMSLVRLGREKGYSLVATSSAGVNAFFVRDDLVDARFLEPIAGSLYSPPAYGPHRGGHPSGTGPFLEI